MVSAIWLEIVQVDEAEDAEEVGVIGWLVVPL